MCIRDRCSAPFLYSPEKIIRIESYDGKNVYELGRDCFVKDGRLFLTRDSRIPQTGWETFYTSQETPSCDGKPGPDFGPVKTTDGKFLNPVSYTHLDVYKRQRVHRHFPQR